MSSLLASFVALLPLVVLPGSDDPARLPQSVFLQVGTLLLCVLHLWPVAERRAAPGARLPRLRALPFLAWAACSLAWVPSRYEALQTLLRWGAAALLFVLVWRSVDSVATARKLLHALFASAFVVSAVGLLQALAGWEALPQAFPPAGTLANKNVAAAFVALALPTGALALASASPGWAWGLSGGLAVTGAFLVHAGSRAAWLAVLVQLLVAALLLAGHRRLPRLPRPVWPALACGAGLFTLLTQLAPAGNVAAQAPPGSLLAATTRPVFRFLGGDGVVPVADAGGATLSGAARAARSVEIRLAVWRNSLEMIREAPLLGHGLGNFSVQYPRFRPAGVPDGTRIDQRVEAAHNDYLQIAVELGLIGVVLIAWLCGAAVRIAVAAVRETEGEARMLCVASGLGLVAIAVVAALAPTLNQPAMLAAFATFLGVAAELRRQPAVDGSAIPPVRTRLSALACDVRFVATAAALVMVSYWGQAEIRADRHLLAMARAEAVGDWGRVIQEGLAARRCNGLRKDASFAVASGYLRLGQPARAVPLLEELIGTNPYDASALGNLGIAHLSLGNLEGARRSLRQALLLRPDSKLAKSKLEEIAQRRASSTMGPV